MEKLYYSIREVSEMLEIALPTLRYWEKEFDELQPKKNDRQTRFYSKEDIALLSLIKYLREEQKLSIQAIKLKLKVDKKGVERRQKIAENLHKIREQLVSLRSSI